MRPGAFVGGPLVRRRLTGPCVATMLVVALVAGGCGSSDEPGEAPASSMGPTITAAADGSARTTSIEAQTTLSPSSSNTEPAETPERQELKWGETATIDGGAVTVDEPVITTIAPSGHPGSVVVYSMVAIANTGDIAVSYSATDFSMEGNSSGSGGMTTGPSELDLPELGSGTLSPGEEAQGIVRFTLKKDDPAVLIRLLVPWSEQVRVDWR
ncbi:MAG: DUF4352 domain-containing protein [Thermoleophilia bacterium]|nr:DUF4352 domain-containing protein [Thermoleophilia bacterium]